MDITRIKINLHTFLAQDMTYLDLLSQGQRLCQLNKFEDALPVLEKALYKVCFLTKCVSLSVMLLIFRSFVDLKLFNNDATEISYCCNNVVMLQESRNVAI